MATSTVVGAAVLTTDEPTVEVLVAANDAAVGSSFADVEVRSVPAQLTDEVAATLIGPATEVPAGTVLTQRLAAGALIPRAALAGQTDPVLVQVPISVDPDQVPPSVAAGSVVDVYVIARSEGHSRSEPVLSGAGVVAAPDPESTMVSTGRRQLVVAVEEEAARAYVSALAGSDQATVTVVRRS